MGVTPWPADFTSAEIDSAYQFINHHCDIVSHHFDDGVPYEEAYNNQPMPTELQQEVQNRISRTAVGKKILLSVAPLNLTRTHKADYYLHSTIDATIKTNWESLPSNHPHVVIAYVKYMSWLIDSFHPNYINYGVESNSGQFNTADFINYKDFLAQVFSQLKTLYPNIPLFVSFMVDESDAGYTNAEQLLPYTDYVALSAYPYVGISSSSNGSTNPALFPANYFEKYIAIAPKPFVIAETGYIAENLIVPSYSINKQGTMAWQNDYLEKISQLCSTHQAKFMIWFCSKDYDAGVATLQSLGLFQDLFLLWQDTGLKDPSGHPRPSYHTWLNWMAKDKI